MKKDTCFNKKLVLPLCFGFLSISGCTNGTSVANLNASLSLASSLPSPGPVSSAPPTARAARFIFQQVPTNVSVPSGSFTAPPTTGTVAGNGTTPAAGLQAQYIFNADGSYLDKVGGVSWPSWITSFQIGISGSANNSAPNSNCANFAGTVEPTSLNCLLGTSTTYSNCGAPTGQFRVSEADCILGGSTQAGNGSPSDGVYMKAVFNRSLLGSAENILVVIEYGAAALNPAPPDPSLCFQGSKFSPENCSDFVWRAYLKHLDSEVVQPYLLLIPPTFSSVLGNVQANVQASGLSLGSKQFVIPLAGDSGLSILQISRTQSQPGLDTTKLKKYCTPGSTPGNSPLCSGVVFYAITFYRI